MSEIIPSTPITPVVSSGFRNRIPAKVTRAVEAQAHTALVNAARIQAGAYVTHHAIQAVTMLSSEEARCMEICPLAEPRLKAIVDSYAGLAAQTVQMMGWS